MADNSASSLAFDSARLLIVLSCALILVVNCSIQAVKMSNALGGSVSGFTLSPSELIPSLASFGSPEFDTIPRSLALDDTNNRQGHIHLLDFLLAANYKSRTVFSSSPPRFPDRQPPFRGVVVQVANSCTAVAIRRRAENFPLVKTIPTAFGDFCPSRLDSSRSLPTARAASRMIFS